MAKKQNYKRSPGTIEITYDQVNTIVRSSDQVEREINSIDQEIQRMTDLKAELQIELDAIKVLEPSNVKEIKLIINMLDSRNTRERIEAVLSEEPYKLNSPTIDDVYAQALAILAEPK